MEAEPRAARRKRPIIWALAGVMVGATAMAGVDRLVLSEPDQPKVVDTYCMPVILDESGEIAPLGVLVRVDEDGYAYAGVLLDGVQEEMRDLSALGDQPLLGGADYCAP